MHFQQCFSIKLLCLLSALMLPVNVVVAQELGVPKGVIKLDGSPAPALTLQNLDGQAYDLSQSKGHWVFVHFWASWCGPCRKELPTINEAMTKLPTSSLEFVFINTAETEDTVFTFLAITAPDIVPLMDNDGLVTERWQPRGLPSTFFIDPQGNKRYLALGGRPWNEPEYLNFLKLITMQK